MDQKWEFVVLYHGKGLHYLHKNVKTMLTFSRSLFCPSKRRPKPSLTRIIAAVLPLTTTAEEFNLIHSCRDFYHLDDWIMLKTLYFSSHN